MTPSGGVRLQSERHRDDAIEIELDTTRRSAAAARHHHARARQPRHPERALASRAATPLVQLTEDDVIEMLLEELRPWLGLRRAL